jgi:hypothetical protein
MSGFYSARRAPSRVSRFYQSSVQGVIDRLQAGEKLHLTHTRQKAVWAIGEGNRAIEISSVTALSLLHSPKVVGCGDGLFEELELHQTWGWRQ